MLKIYVAGALLPTGGAYMAYRIGYMLHRHFGYELVNLEVQKPDKILFHYDIAPKTISVAEFERNVRPDDVLVCNPSFSHFLFGSRVHCRKLMYVQDFRTFNALDGRFDHYVAVSEVVQKFLHSVYDIEAPVIPAFIDSEAMPLAPSWHERPAGSMIFYLKNGSYEHRLLYQEWAQRIKGRLPQVDVSQVIEGRNLPHTEFLKRLGSVRYLVNISLAEGFGLAPLEAMALGTVVVGTDALGGKDYMQQNVNSMTVSVDNLMEMPELLAGLINDEARGLKLSQQGKETAGYYHYSIFKQRWLKELSVFLGRQPKPSPLEGEGGVAG